MKRVDDGGPGVTAQTYLAQTVICLWENLPQVLLGAIFLSLAGTPFFVLAVLGLPWLALVVALPSVMPAWTALLWLEAELAQGRAASVADAAVGFSPDLGAQRADGACRRRAGRGGRRAY